MHDPAPDVKRAQDAWVQMLGDEWVETGDRINARYIRNISGLKRTIPTVLRPANTEEVRRVVEIANQYRTPLYPIITGHNWGLGSCLPPVDGAAIVDLGRMNRIHEVNVDHHYAVVEPGVTQQQLFEYLRDHDVPLMLNVTGSGAHTSLIGNSLERGIGYFSSRAEGLSGLEVVLGNGTVIRTGFGHYEASKVTHHYRHGIGPELDGLFFQSNFGVVTRAGFDLIPQKDEQLSVIVKLADETRFESFIEALVDLRRRDVLRTVWHVGNRHRSEISLSPLIYDVLLAEGMTDHRAAREAALQILQKEGFGPWNAVGGVFGSAGSLRVMRKEISARLKGIAQVMYLNDRKMEGANRLLSKLSFLKIVRRKHTMLKATLPLYGMSNGVPSDGPLKSVLWPLGEETAGKISNPDLHQSGMMYVLPFFPLSGRCAREVVEMAHTSFARYGFEPAITINFVDAKAAEAVISLPFDLNNEKQTSAAHDCIDALTEAYIQRGYMPYRVGVQSMARVVDEADPFWRVVRDLKKVFDPNHIIAPGRYNLV